MKKLSMLLTALAGVVLLAPAAFAQGGEAAAPVNWVAITAGFSMAIASAG